MNDDAKYLRQLGVWPVKIITIDQKKAGESKGGKPYPAKIAVTFEAKDGRLIDGTYRLPLTDPKHKWDKGQLQELMKVCKASKMSELKDKELAIVVAPKEFNGKVFWNVLGTFDLSHLLGEEAKLDEALGEIDSLMNGDPNDPGIVTDDLPF